MHPEDCSVFVFGWKLTWFGVGIESCVEFVCGLRMTWLWGGIKMDLPLVRVVEINFVYCVPADNGSYIVWA